MGLPVITIAREYGSGGRIIGEQLAESLHIPFYDKELISLAAQKSGLSEDFIRRTEQMKSTSFLYNLYMNTQALPMSDQIFLIQSEIIRELAGKGPCVIVGRCGDYILRNVAHCMKVFIHAPLEQRVRRAAEEYGDTAPRLEDYVRKQDKKRAAYYNYFCQNKWDDFRQYHMTVNSNLGISETVELLKSSALSMAQRLGTDGDKEKNALRK